MNVEFIEFYPLNQDEEKGFLTGTLRIKLPDIGIHILGIFVTKRKDSWFFNFPGRNGTHHKTGEPVRYPFIVFEDRDQQRSLMTAIREQGRAFIEKRLADTENPLVFPHREQKNQKMYPSVKKCDNVTEAKQMAKISSPSISCNVGIDKPRAMKEYRDPPPRKIQPKYGTSSRK